MKWKQLLVIPSEVFEDNIFLAFLWLFHSIGQLCLPGEFAGLQSNQRTIPRRQIGYIYFHHVLLFHKIVHKCYINSGNDSCGNPGITLFDVVMMSDILSRRWPSPLEISTWPTFKAIRSRQVLCKQEQTLTKPFEWNEERPFRDKTCISSRIFSLQVFSTIPYQHTQRINSNMQFKDWAGE